MKKLLFMYLALATFGMMSMSSDEASTTVNGEQREYVYIKLKNECDHAVKYEYKYSGGGTSGSLSANYQRQITLQTGAKLYIDGNFIKEITKGDDKISRT